MRDDATGGVFVKALHHGRPVRLIETTGECAIVLDEGRQIVVPLSAPELVIDPTDKQVAAATNANSWFGVEGDRAADFCAMRAASCRPRSGNPGGKR